MSTPEIRRKDHMYLLLREGKIKQFNENKALGEAIELAGTDLRGLDLRGLDAEGIDFSNCYFRQADLRGIDFSTCKMDGASINGAKISGCRFPAEFSASELELSLLHGTRLREGC